MYKGCALTRDAPALIVMPDIVGIQTVRDSISLDADTGKQRRLSANRDFFVTFGHCIIGHNLSSPYIKKQDTPHGLPCKSKGRASEDALPVVHNNPPSHDPAAWPSVPLPRPGERGSGAWRKTAPASCCGNRGGSYTLLVLSQALTQLLAGILDGSLSGCQNYRAFVLLHHDINHYRMTFLERSTKK